MSKLDEFESYMYVASDVSFNNDTNVLTKLCNLHFSRNNIGITSAVVDYDSGIESWLGYDVFNSILEHENYIVPIGKTCNLHGMIFDKKILKSYNNRILPDIFRTFCTESVFSFLVPALDMKFIIHNKSLTLKDLGDSDGSSGGFIGNRGWNDLFMSKLTLQERLLTQEACDVGFGYEECQKILLHNQSMYDENGNHCDPKKLLEFNLKSIFLTNDEFEYDNINYVKI